MERQNCTCCFTINILVAYRRKSKMESIEITNYPTTNDTVNDCHLAVKFKSIATGNNSQQKPEISELKVTIK